MQAASANRGHAGIPNQWSQLFGKAFVRAAGRCGNGWRVGAGASLPLQHAPEHLLPKLVARHGLDSVDQILWLLSYRRTDHEGDRNGCRTHS